MEDSETQEEEMTVLLSIYEKEVFQADAVISPICGRLVAKPDISAEFYQIVCRVTENGDNDKLENLVRLDVQHLPPIILHFRLPGDYPSMSAPSYTLSCKWLGRQELSKLCNELDRIWEEEFKGRPVLFEWLQFLQGRGLTYLEIPKAYDMTWFYQRRKTLSRNTSQRLLTQELEASKAALTKNDVLASPCEMDTCQENNLCKQNSASSARRRPAQRLDRRTVQDVSPEVDLLPVMLDYDTTVRQEKFEAEYHLCNICFEDKQGSRCLRFVGCDHLFCKDCIKGYLEVSIQEGNVVELKCPGVKCPSLVLAFQVRDLVEPEIYARYDALLLASSIASMDVVYCPRPTCQYPITVDRVNNIGSCPSCRFHFCIYCHMTYHGVETCKFSSADRRKMYEEYTAAFGEDKKLMEKRYGKKQLESLTSDVLAEFWMEENSKPCPKCKSHIEKIDGCNKMHCWSCNTLFCWLCLTRLNPGTPYRHFEDPKSECNNRLFAGTFVEHEEEEEREEEEPEPE